MISTCMEIYSRVYEKKLLKGMAVHPLTMAVFMISCRKLMIPCTFQELSRLTKVSKKDLGRYTKIIQTTLQETIEPISVDSYIERYAKELGMTVGDVQLVQHVVNRAADYSGISSRCHLSVIAGCMYATTLVSRTMSRYSKKAISDAIGIAETTLTNSFRALLPHLVNIFPPQYKIFFEDRNNMAIWDSESSATQIS